MPEQGPNLADGADKVPEPVDEPGSDAFDTRPIAQRSLRRRSAPVHTMDTDITVAAKEARHILREAAMWELDSCTSVLDFDANIYC